MNSFKKYQKPSFYYKLFDESKEGTSEVPNDCTKVGIIIKPVPGSTKVYNVQDIKGDCVFYSLSYTFIFVGDQITVDHFKDDILPYLKAKNRIQFALDV